MLAAGAQHPAAVAAWHRVQGRTTQRLLQRLLGGQAPPHRGTGKALHQVLLEGDGLPAVARQVQQRLVEGTAGDIEVIGLGVRGRCRRRRLAERQGAMPGQGHAKGQGQRRQR